MIDPVMPADFAAGADPGLRTPHDVPRPAARGIAIITGLTWLAFTVKSAFLPYFGDELYYLSAGRRLAFGYADQGPLVPLSARLADLVAPGSMVVLRAPSVLMTVLTVVLTALIARELGGGRGAQLLAAGTYATSFLAVTLIPLGTSAFDATLTVTITWLLIRWIRTRQDWTLVAVGLVAAVDIQVKLMIPITLACLGAGIVLTGPREILRRPALWLAGALLVVSALPNLYWQSQHNWPELGMPKVISAEEDAGGGGPLALLPEMIGYAGPLGLLLLVVGGWSLWRRDSLRPYRFLVPALVIMSAFFVVEHGRPYYPTGLFPALFAAGATGLLMGDHGRRTVRAVQAIAVVSALTIAAVLIVLPLPAARRNPPHTAAELGSQLALYWTTGWDALAATTSAGFHTLPPEERSGVVIVAQNYWQAGAIEELGRQYDLPATYSPSRGLGYAGPPPDSATTVIYVGLDTSEPTLRTEFAQVQLLEKLDNPNGYPGVDRMVAVWKCQGPLRPWSVMWDSMTTLSVDSGVWHDPAGRPRPTHSVPH